MENCYVLYWHWRFIWSLSRYESRKPVEKDAGMLEKMDRLKSIGVDVVHLGVCTKNNGVECDTITRIAQCLSQRGIKVVRGTH